ncbi:MAG: phenylalanine--tRNA ligase subunit alpha, partial [Desulfotomaculales bacterium]
MEKALLEMAEKAEAALARAGSQEEINAIRVRFLGKKGELTRILRGLGELPAEERPRIGQVANAIRQTIEDKIATRTREIKEKERELRLRAEKIDVTLPGTGLLTGHLHPLTLVSRRIEDIFLGLGFEIVEGPEVELDYYNFEALNIPKDHPARDMQDTFFISEEVLLRTHTSPVQVRTMERMVPRIPVKVIAPGKVYRRDDDATHSPMFHQVEGLLLDRRITFGDLKGVLQTFAV